MKILIADDHAVVRKGLIGILSNSYPSAQITEANNGIDVVHQLHSDTDWDLIILDISMPGMNGIETLKQLKYEEYKTPILVFSMQAEDQYAIRVLKAGAAGYVKKDNSTEELIPAIEKILSGRKYISPSVAEILADVMHTSEGKEELYELLSDREMQVMQLIANGKTVSDIADMIFLSVNTVRTYRARILEKLSLHNNAEITRYAIENKLV